MTWDNRYRQLAEGEIIRSGDEVLCASHRGWEPAVHAVGQRAPCPLYTSHRIYRRLKDAPAGRAAVKEGRDEDRDHPAE